VSSAKANFTALIPFLGVLAALGPLSNDLYVPSLTLVAAGLDVAPGPVQLTMSSLLLGFALGALVHGPLSDRFGRKPILCIGLAFYVFASMLSAFATDLNALIASRALQGLGASSAMVLSRAIILDRWSGAEASRAISWVSMFTFLTPVIAPIAGGYVASWGHWQTVFWAQAAAGLLCLLGTLTMLRRVHKAREVSILRSLAGYLVIVKDRQALGYMACTGFGFIGVIAFVTNSSLVLIDNFGLAPQQYGYGFAFVMSGASIGSFLNGRLVRQLGISRLLGIGTALLAAGGSAGLLSAVLGGGVPGILLSSLLYIFGIGFVFANATARTLSRFPMNAGAASSIFGVNQFLIGALVAAGLSTISEPTALPLAVTMAVAGLGCGAIWWGWLRAGATNSLTE
jgi:MFS transporter, DHA1 family, multidrug resistance protein